MQKGRSFSTIENLGNFGLKIFGIMILCSIGPIGHYTGHHQLSEWTGLDAGPQEASAGGGGFVGGQPPEGHEPTHE